jgi:hypothetical protein
MKGEKIVDLVIVKLEEKSAFLTPQGSTNPILVTGDNIDELKPVYSYIDAHIAEAANEVLLAAPLNRLTPENITIESIDNGMTYLVPYAKRPDGSGIILLPPNYLRLYTIKMRGWGRPVHKAITKTDHLYTLQHNKFTKGTPQKPVVIFSGVRGYYDNYVLDDGTDLFDKMEHNGEDPLTGTVVKYKGIGVHIIRDGRVFVNKEEDNTDFVEVDQIPYLEYYSVQGETHEIEELSYIPHFRLSLDYNRDVAEAIALNCAKKVMEVFGNADGIVLLEKELTTVLNNMKL